MDLLHLYLNEKHTLILEVSPWIIAPVLLFVAWLVWKTLKSKSLQHFDLVSLNVQLGGVGKVEFKPNVEDIHIAHKIWTELVTRKAALLIDPEHDIIVEIYDSWYALFLRVRQLIGDIPGQLVRNEESTQKLVRIATDTLNLGLRPHLTQWRARFKNWYAQRAADLKEKTPQELQREFPEYKLLVADMQKVNQLLIQYAGELNKIVRGC